MSAIELNHLTKTFPGCMGPAVFDFNLTIGNGEIITLLGPSGCGKTTTLRMIAGFEKADGGQIAIGGRTVSDRGKWIPPEKRDVGMVFQDYALFPHLTVEENVGFGYRRDDRGARVQEVLRLVNMEELRGRYPHELSGGQQQRVALARALARRPAVILLDEPFSNLDADLREQMRVEVRRILKEARTTAILVSHDQKDALAISDRIVVMEAGTVVQVGTPREIYQYPENRFVATFVGRTNLLDGTVGRDGRSVETMLGTIPCEHTHNKNPGEPVEISVRPDSLELDPQGDIEGVVHRATYVGDAIDGVLQVSCGEDCIREILVHIHPEEDIQEGQRVRFRVLPHFIAVLQGETDKRPDA